MYSLQQTYVWQDKIVDVNSCALTFGSIVQNLICDLVKVEYILEDDICGT